MNFLSEEQVTQLAPDAASLKAGKDLANEQKWNYFEANDRALWGEMKGSGKEPYRTQVDLINTAFNCSCPSRKFPCKHSLGLLIIYARREGVVNSSIMEPEWVSQWINKRIEKAETRKAKEEEESHDPEKQEKLNKDKEKRQNERWLKVKAGIDELDLWLRDMVRGGLLLLPEKPGSYFDKMAARLIDAQATGLANMVREFSRINYFEGEIWQIKATELASKIHLLIEAIRNIEKMPWPWQEEIKQRIGWNIQQKELNEHEHAKKIEDNWLVIGRKTTTEEDITMQRNWLYGCNSGTIANVINFAYKSIPIETPLVPGLLAKAVLVFYPGVSAYRAIIGLHLENKAVLPSELQGCIDLEEAQNQFATQLSLNPWLDELPQLIEDLRLVKHNNRWFLQDRQRAMLPVAPQTDEQKIWKLLAYSMGHFQKLFVLRYQNALMPLGVVQTNVYKLL